MDCCYIGVAVGACFIEKGSILWCFRNRSGALWTTFNITASFLLPDIWGSLALPVFVLLLPCVIGFLAKWVKQALVETGEDSMFYMICDELKALKIGVTMSPE